MLSEDVGPGDSAVLEIAAGLDPVLNRIVADADCVRRARRKPCNARKCWKSIPLLVATQGGKGRVLRWRASIIRSRSVMPGIVGTGNSGSAPLNAQTRPQASALGNVNIREPGGILSPVGM